MLKIIDQYPLSITCIVIKIMERVVRDKLMDICGHMIDKRQHGFLQYKSCTTQLVDICDSLALSLNKNIRSDLIHLSQTSTSLKVSRNVP